MDILENKADNSNAQTDVEPLNTVKKPLFKKWWFWAAIIAIVIAIAVTVYLVLNREIKPKLDDNDEPIFIEMTDEVYTNADDYLGYSVTVSGKVFQVLGDTGTSKGVQIWLDPKTSEQNMWIYYTNDVDIKQGDYVVCSGYIKSVTKYDNNYGAELFAPLLISNDMKKSNYIEVMSPTIASLEFDDTKGEQHNYSIAVNKVEFAENETRVYFTADNKGSATMYTGLDDAVILQNGKQYSVKHNYDAEYEEIPYELYSGAASTGIVSFPKIEKQDFQLIVEIHSDDMEEKFEKFVFNISPKNKSATVEPIEGPKKTSAPQYRSVVGTYQMGIETLCFYGGGSLGHYVVGDENDAYGSWTQNGNTVNFTLTWDGFENGPLYETCTIVDGGIMWGSNFFSKIG